LGDGRNLGFSDRSVMDQLAVRIDFTALDLRGMGTSYPANYFTIDILNRVNDAQRLPPTSPQPRDGPGGDGLTKWVITGCWPRPPKLLPRGILFGSRRRLLRTTAIRTAAAKHSSQRS